MAAAYPYLLRFSVAKHTINGDDGGSCAVVATIYLEPFKT